MIKRIMSFLHNMFPSVDESWKIDYEVNAHQLSRHRDQTLIEKQRIENRLQEKTLVISVKDEPIANDC